MISKLKARIILLLGIVANILFLHHFYHMDAVKMKFCSEVRRLVFLKTQKTAGSSLQNILLRYGEKNNLTFAVPFKSHTLYGKNWNLVGSEYNISYDMFVLHTRYNYEKLSNLMGNTNRTTYITIIRDPVDIFISAWYYYKLENRYQMTLDQFSSASEEITKRKPGSGYIGANQILTDFSVYNIYDNDEVMAKVHEVENTFHLVLIVEKFQESLILMKDLLCWDIKEIKNLKINTRKETKETEVSQETRNNLKKIMAPDYKFYDHFKEILDRKINKYGIKQMKKDLVDLEEINKEVTEKCNFTLSDNKDLPAQNKQWGFAQMVGFQYDKSSATDEECNLMTLNEPSYVARIRKEHLEKYPNLDS